MVGREQVARLRLVMTGTRYYRLQTVSTDYLQCKIYKGLTGPYKVGAQSFSSLEDAVWWALEEYRLLPQVPSPPPPPPPLAATVIVPDEPKSAFEPSTSYQPAPFTFDPAKRRRRDHAHALSGPRRSHG